jgi:hypothetical protein
LRLGSGNAGHRDIAAAAGCLRRFLLLKTAFELADIDAGLAGLLGRCGTQKSEQAEHKSEQTSVVPRRPPCPTVVNP